MPKLSYAVGFKAAQTLYYAEEQARRIGRAMTASITINWSLLGINPANAVTCFMRMRSQRFAPWVRRPPRGQGLSAVEPTYSYGFENSRDGIPFIDPHGPHNVHVHWVVHVPLQRWNDFEYSLRTWLDEVAGREDWPENALKINPITWEGGAVRYPIKGASFATADHFGQGAKQAHQGVILGMRTGTSRNIGPSARRQADRDAGIVRQRLPKPRKGHRGICQGLNG